MSFCTFGVAVAVTAMKGTPGRLSLNVPSCLNCSAGHNQHWVMSASWTTEAFMQRQCRAAPSERHACKLSYACSGQRISKTCLAARPTRGTAKASVSHALQLETATHMT